MAKKRSKPTTPPVVVPPPPLPPTPLEQAFVEAIVADPDDDTARFAYADWFEENGQPERAEFIRLQIERARLPWRDPARHQAGPRESALYQAHREKWLEYLARSVPHNSFYFDRGFPDMAFCELDHFIRWDESVWQVAPFTRLSLSDFYHQTGEYRDPDEWQALLHGVAAKPELARFRGLELSESGIWADDLPVLLGSPHLGGLRSLTVNYQGIGDVVASTVARMVDMPSLTYLSVMGEYLSVEGLRTLLASPFIGGLDYLMIGQNAFGDEGAELLAASPQLRNLPHLNLLEARLTDRGARALAASPHLADLEYLDLLANYDITPEGQAVLRERFGERVNFTAHG